MVPTSGEMQAPPAQLPSTASRDTDNADTVLVIDDDSTVRDMLRRFLAREGFDVITARDGSTGLRLAKELQPSVITLDVVMAGMDGWEVLGALKTDTRTNNIPVVMLSILDEQKAGYTLGASDYLTKPIDSRDLLDTVARLATHQKVKRDKVTGQRQAVGANIYELPLADHDTISALRKISADENFISTLVDGFVNDGRRLLSDLQNAVDTRDYPALRNALHALKGSSSELGCKQLVTVCQNGHNIKPPDMQSTRPAELANQVGEVFERTIKELARHAAKV